MRVGSCLSEFLCVVSAEARDKEAKERKRKMGSWQDKEGSKKKGKRGKEKEGGKRKGYRGGEKTG